MDIRLETQTDHEVVENLYDHVFGPTRTLLSSYQLRCNVEPVKNLCFVIEEDSTIIAVIRYWPVCLYHESKLQWPSLLLGPIAVHPTHQGEGLGHMLMSHSLDVATTERWARVFLVGDEPYYRRFGFTVMPQDIIEFPPNTNPSRCLAKELVKGGLKNVRGALARCER
jgi:predicted N-acetyltransferase YhbS